jgi:bacterioferritin-associated ferredoxin
VRPVRSGEEGAFLHIDLAGRVAPGNQFAAESEPRDHEIRAAVHLGADTLDAIGQHLGVGTRCGCCRETAARLFGMQVADVLLVTAEPGRAAELAAPLAAIAKNNDLLIRSFADFRERPNLLLVSDVRIPRQFDCEVEDTRCVLNSRWTIPIPKKQPWYWRPRFLTSNA